MGEPPAMKNQLFTAVEEGIRKDMEESIDFLRNKINMFFQRPNGANNWSGDELCENVAQHAFERKWEALD